MKKLINILIIHGNSQGLLNDANILEKALNQSNDINCVVRLSKFNSLFKNAYDLSSILIKSAMPARKLIIIHLEELQSGFIPFSKTHLFFPNQEWFRSDTAKALQQHKTKTIVCCKTQYAEEQFKRLVPHVRFTGFSSIDKFDPQIPKEPLSFLHIAGKSEQKGTNNLLEAWSKHPEWPLLTVVSRRKEHLSADGPNINIISKFISDKELLEQINNHPVHLCPSESEGFGHTIWEGYSTNAMVVTTNAPPMNEFIVKGQPYSFACTKFGKRYLSDLFKVSPENITDTITDILTSFDPASLKHNDMYRQHYISNKKLFEDRLEKLISELL